MKQQQQEKREFDAFSSEYAELIRDPIREKFAASNRFFFERKLDVIGEFFRAHGRNARELAWLDLGCGQGDMLRAGKSYFKSATGCDPSAGMLESCRGLDVKHQPSPEILPFENQSFDFVTAVCVYHHVPEDRRVAFTAEALRVIKPGGVFCVIEHNPFNPITRLIVSRTPVDAGAHLMSAAETRRLLSSTGARVVETRYFLLLPERVYRYIGAAEDWLGRVPVAGQYSVFSSIM